MFKFIHAADIHLDRRLAMSDRHHYERRTQNRLISQFHLASQYTIGCEYTPIFGEDPNQHG